MKYKTTLRGGGVN